MELVEVLVVDVQDLRALPDKLLRVVTEKGLDGGIAPRDAAVRPLNNEGGVGKMTQDRFENAGNPAVVSICDVLHDAMEAVHSYTSLPGSSRLCGVVCWALKA